MLSFTQTPPTFFKRKWQSSRTLTYILTCTCTKFSWCVECVEWPRTVICMQKESNCFEKKRKQILMMFFEFSLVVGVFFVARVSDNLSRLRSFPHGVMLPERLSERREEKALAGDLTFWESCLQLMTSSWAMPPMPSDCRILPSDVYAGGEAISKKRELSLRYAQVCLAPVRSQGKPISSKWKLFLANTVWTHRLDFFNSLSGDRPFRK